MSYKEKLNKKTKRKKNHKNLSIVQGTLLVVVFLISGCKREEISWNTKDAKSNSSENQQAETDWQNVTDYDGENDHGGENDHDDENDQKDTQVEQIDRADLCYVYVCGEVNEPGVYTLLEGSRAFEAIEMAGGLSELAATDYINQAELIKDGMKLEIPTKEEADVLEETIKSEQGGLVNINTASKDALMSIPGIGEGRAQAILDYREKSGEFLSLDDLLKVDGIKQGIYDKMKDHITL